MDEGGVYVNMDEPSGAADGKQNKTCSHKISAVILGLLCLLLLTGLAALAFLYTKSTLEKVVLETSYNNLTEDRDQLQTSYNQLHERAGSLTRMKNDLLGALQTECSRQKWMYFQNSFYYISLSSKSWHDSRHFCQQRGGDLLIINSEEEQEFVRHVWKVVWIGLTDSDAEGKWKWVDGTQLNTSFWARNEPNSYGGEEDCGEIKLYSYKNSWNDSPCHIKRSWICEWKVGP